MLDHLEFRPLEQTGELVPINLPVTEGGRLYNKKIKMNLKKKKRAATRDNKTVTGY